jgi:hypothetical protein
VSFVDCRGMSVLLCSRSLACVLSCVFVFDTTTPFAYTVSDVAWRIYLPVRFAADPFHLDWQRQDIAWTVKMMTFGSRIRSGDV